MPHYSEQGVQSLKHDYTREELSRMLNPVYATFETFVEEHKEEFGRLGINPTLTREHQEGLDVNLYWKTKEGMDRVIEAAMDDNEYVPSSPKLTVGAGAHFFEDNGKGSMIHKFRGTRPTVLMPPFQTERLKMAVERAYQHVSSWKPEDLRIVR